MKQILLMTVAAVGCVLSACGGDGPGYFSGGGGPPNGGGNGATTQYVAPTDSVFVAATDPNNPGITYGPTQGMYAGARLFITASVVAGQPTTNSQSDYAQMYKASDGHLYGVNLLVAGMPQANQVSSESHATIDDLCSLNGANATLGTTVNYVAVQSYVDYANPSNSVYFYRVPGTSGECNTSTDEVFMVKLGMGQTDAPIQALMPAAVIHDPSSGAITGFVVNEGTALTLYDANFQNRTVIYAPTTAMSVVYSLASGGVTATGGLFVIDGNIVYVNYAGKTVSASLFVVPNWNPAKRFDNSANGSTEFFSVNTSNAAATPVVPTSAVYSMPLDGSAVPTQLATESGLVNQVVVAIYGTTVAWSVVPPAGVYTIRTLAAGATTPITAFAGTGNSGSFFVTANNIYYTTSTYSAPNSATIVYSNTQTGIVAMSGAVVQAPVPNTRFVAVERDANGSNWVDIILAQNLTPVTVNDASNGDTYTEDGISGATLSVLDTSTNELTVTLGTLPSGIIMQGSGTLISSAGYVDGINVNSTADPSTRELIYIDTTQPNSLMVLTNNL